MRLPFNILVIKTFCWDRDQIYGLPVVSHDKEMVHVGYLEHRSPLTWSKTAKADSHQLWPPQL